MLIDSREGDESRKLQRKVEAEWAPGRFTADCVHLG